MTNDTRWHATRAESEVLQGAVAGLLAALVEHEAPQSRSVHTGPFNVEARWEGGEVRISVVMAPDASEARARLQREWEELTLNGRQPYATGLLARQMND